MDVISKRFNIIYLRGMKEVTCNFNNTQKDTKYRDLSIVTKFSYTVIHSIETPFSWNRSILNVK